MTTGARFTQQQHTARAVPGFISFRNRMFRSPTRRSANAQLLGGTSTKIWLKNYVLNQCSDPAPVANSRAILEQWKAE